MAFGWYRLFLAYFYGTTWQFFWFFFVFSMHTRVYVSTRGCVCVCGVFNRSSECPIFMFQFFGSRTFFAVKWNARLHFECTLRTQQYIRIAMNAAHRPIPRLIWLRTMAQLLFVSNTREQPWLAVCESMLGCSDSLPRCIFLFYLVYLVVF